MNNIIKFTKMHGIGNDYIYINCLRQKISNPNQLAGVLSERHFAIGSDGLVLILPSDIADFKMRMFNPDGSEAEMCGNAIRCVAKFVYDAGFTNKKELKIETKAGTKELFLSVIKGFVNSVTVNMGIPILDGKNIPVTIKNEIINKEIIIGRKRYNITCVSMGNPHCILFYNDLNDKIINNIGPIIEKAEIFPKRTNVEFVKIENRNEITLRVWERGTGEALACGTGACAACVAAHLNKLTNRKIIVHLLGGYLNVEWSKDSNVYMTGPAEFVYTGEINLKNLSRNKKT